jgi:hypothetical protein
MFLEYSQSRKIEKSNDLKDLWEQYMYYQTLVFFSSENIIQSNKEKSKKAKFLSP